MKKKFSVDQKKARAAYAREWRRNNPEKSAAHAKTSRSKNKDKVLKRQRKWVEENKEKHINNSKEWYKNNKEKVRNRQLIRTFGISIVQYNEMLAAQNGVCSLCGGGPDAKNKMLAVDHCHKTGKIRSLLCRGCNVGIGNLKDDPQLLENAAKYIRRFNEQEN